MVKCRLIFNFENKTKITHARRKAEAATATAETARVLDPARAAVLAAAALCYSWVQKYVHPVYGVVAVDGTVPVLPSTQIMVPVSVAAPVLSLLALQQIQSLPQSEP